MRQCSNCKAPIKEGTAFCTNCGARIAAEPSAASGSFFSAANSLDGDLSAPVSKPTPRPAPTPTAPVAPPPPPPKKADVPVKRASSRRISPAKELMLLLRQGILILLGEKRNLIISLLFPLIAAVITVWIAGENMFVAYTATRSGCFILVCAAIWGGLFNSIQSLVKERDNIKRDYVSGALRIECYMGSRAIIQTVLCAFQSFVLTLSIPAIEWFWGNTIPGYGLVLGNMVFLEFYITLFLIMLASDAMGLLISSFVKKEELASKLAPYILIAQLLFSGLLFPLEGGAETLSAIMVSRWGMEALGSTSDLNSINTETYISLTENSHNCPFAAMSSTGECCYTGIIEQLHKPKQSGTTFEMFEASSDHVLEVWAILLLFVVVSLIAADLLLHRVKKDGRD